jgi:hypothetical protein
MRDLIPTRQANGWVQWLDTSNNQVLWEKGRHQIIVKHGSYKLLGKHGGDYPSLAAAKQAASRGPAHNPVGVCLDPVPSHEYFLPVTPGSPMGETVKVLGVTATRVLYEDQVGGVGQTSRKRFAYASRVNPLSTGADVALVALVIAAGVGLYFATRASANTNTTVVQGHYYQYSENVGSVPANSSVAALQSSFDNIVPGLFKVTNVNFQPPGTLIVTALAQATQTFPAFASGTFTDLGTSPPA